MARLTAGIKYATDPNTHMNPAPSNRVFIALEIELEPRGMRALKTLGFETGFSDAAEFRRKKRKRSAHFENRNRGSTYEIDCKAITTSGHPAASFAHDIP